MQQGKIECFISRIGLMQDDIESVSKYNIEDAEIMELVREVKEKIDKIKELLLKEYKKVHK